MRQPEVREREAAAAARWAAGAWRGATLTTARGDTYRVVYEGRRGGGAGPDFRDAILAHPDGSRVYGDVELHLRAGNWRSHGHERDLRYARVALHVVFHPLAPGAPTETLLPTGETAPIVVLNNPAPQGGTGSSLPCVGLARRLPAQTMRTLLLDAGRARFAERANRLMRELAIAATEDAAGGSSRWRPVERVLWVNIAEALGYGRDRESLRRAGEALAGGAGADTIRRECAQLARLDGARLDALLRLSARWAQTGPWEPLRRALVAGTARTAAVTLPRTLCEGSTNVSPARARIVVANVVLPCVAAFAALEGDTTLEDRARAVYDALLGLPSNAITRLMSRQLGMARLPDGACAQQGLHHLWAAWCREKRCETCPCNRAYQV